VVIEATKTYAFADDADSNGEYSPGDTIQYTVEITNTAGNTAQNVVYRDIVDPNTTLNCSPLALSTDQGTFDACLSGSGELVVNVGDIGGWGVVTITFQVIIDLPLSAGVTQVSNQGLIYGSNFATEPTDDPDTGVEDDATVTPVLGVAIDPARKTDSLLFDADNNGMVSTGDIILYEVTFWNIGNMDATGVIYSDTPDPSTDFVVGTVTCDKDGWSLITDSPGLLVVDIGTVLGFSQEMVTVTIQAIVLRMPWGDPYYTGPGSSGNRYTIYNQGVIYTDQAPLVLTDDPHTPASGDPTGTSLWDWAVASALPVFPNLYVGIAAAFMAGILAYFLRRRYMRQ